MHTFLNRNIKLISLIASLCIFLSFVSCESADVEGSETVEATTEVTTETTLETQENDEESNSAVVGIANVDINDK